MSVKVLYANRTAQTFQEVLNVVVLVGMHQMEFIVKVSYIHVYCLYDISNFYLQTLMSAIPHPGHALKSVPTQ